MYISTMWMRDIVIEKKKCLKVSDMKFDKAPPCIDGLRVQDFVKFLKDRGLEDYLPSKTRGLKESRIERRWLALLCSNIDYEGFRAMI